MFFWARSGENVFMPDSNNKGADDQPAYPHSLISTFVVRCLDSIISLVFILAISCLASFCSWADRFESYLVKNPKTGFLVTRLRFCFITTNRFTETSVCGWRVCQVISSQYSSYKMAPRWLLSHPEESRPIWWNLMPVSTTISSPLQERRLAFLCIVFLSIFSLLLKMCVMSESFF